MDGNGKPILCSDGTPILIDQATKTYQVEYDSITMSTPNSEFRGLVDDRASPETPARKIRPYDEAFFQSPNNKLNLPPCFEGELYEGEENYEIPPTPTDSDTAQFKRLARETLAL